MVNSFLSPHIVIIEFFILVTCILGDLGISNAFLSNFHWLKALVDEGTHGTVGMLSWAVVCTGQLYCSYPLFEVILSGVLAVVIDFDHFIAAGAFTIQAVLSLTRRPPFHNSTLIPIIMCILFLGLKHLCPVNLHALCANVPLIFFISWSSHHIRDATRRGLWVWPFGCTSPLPVWSYRSLVCAMPLVLRLGLIAVHSRNSFNSNNSPTLLASVV